MKALLLRLIFVFAALVVFSCCHKREDKYFKVNFSDHAGLYTEEFQQMVTNHFKFPKGINVTVITVDSIPQSKIRSLTSELVAGTATGNGKESLQRVSDKEIRRNTVFIIVSRVPHLVQIKYGSNLMADAYKSGLAGGYKYKLYQDNFIKNGYEDGLTNLLQYLQKDLPSALEISGFAKVQMTGVMFVSQSIDFAYVSLKNALYQNLPLLSVIDISQSSFIQHFVQNGWLTSNTSLWIVVILFMVILVIQFPIKFNSAMSSMILIDVDCDIADERLTKCIIDVFTKILKTGLVFSIIALFMPLGITVLVIFYFLLKLPYSIIRYSNFFNIGQDLRNSKAHRFGTV